ncbi:MAG: PEP/pyruvate-binding domain-containing protein [Desulfobacterales bacterium]
MKRFGHLIRKFFPAREELEPADVDALRLDFKERYRNFQQLISANNKALDIMAGIELALKGERPFGMTFVRGSATAIAVDVYRMVKKIMLLAPGKYDELVARFNQIQKEIEQILTEKKPLKDDRLILHLNHINKDMADVVGGKMANLGEIRNAVGLRVPPGFVITSAAYQKFFDHNDLRTEINRRLQSADLEDIQQLYTLQASLDRLIVEAGVPPDLVDAILEAWRATEEEAGFEITAALRSSALGEDETGSSFAGMHRSELNISAQNVIQAYKEIVASKYSLQAMTYRMKKGFKDEDIAMCVGCLVMVDALAGGVMYSRNPIDIHDDAIFINSAWGLPKAVVDGTIDCDLFVVSRQPALRVIHQDVKDKDRKFVCYPLEGVCRIDLTADGTRRQPSLFEEQVLALAEMAVRMEAHYGAPQDIEWAIGHAGEIYILQCRPLQQVAATVRSLPQVPRKQREEEVLIEGGVTASPGAVAGAVHRLERGIDMLAFPEGGILVAREALPRWASLINRAAAVVTEHGSFAGHLANVAREFGVPALFGIAGAMTLLGNGDLVTVDATGKTIYRGRLEYLLAAVEKKQGLMEGSPVYNTLRQVSAFIVPLNLLDPAAPEFVPKNCRTLHDITRFIHEKSVREMFSFGKEHNFSERSSKQLYYKVPMQWWILNLDDGYRDEVKGKYVKLENIVSVPMLAFWEGFTAIVWDGPPAIDGKGLMSVMFQSTANTALNTGRRTRFADHNYFMISKNFCNLSSRLGYHFNTMEALVSERNEENYVKFQFKGGAADLDRKVRRAGFIGRLLEDHGFKTEVVEDNLEARTEGHDPEFMKKCIEIIGYLCLHTRQIDMIMSNETMVKYYRAKFDKEIDYLVNAHQRVFYH